MREVEGAWNEYTNILFRQSTDILARAESHALILHVRLQWINLLEQATLTSIRMNMCMNCPRYAARFLFYYLRYIDAATPDESTSGAVYEELVQDISRIQGPGCELVLPRSMRS